MERSEAKVRCADHEKENHIHRTNISTHSECFFVGKTLPSREKYLDMETIVDFDATETGLMLYTQDGSGYYWERNAN